MMLVRKSETKALRILDKSLRRPIIGITITNNSWDNYRLFQMIFEVKLILADYKKIERQIKYTEPYRSDTKAVKQDNTQLVATKFCIRSVSNYNLN